MVKLTTFYCRKCHHQFVPTKEQRIAYFDDKIDRPDTCGICQVIISEKERKRKMRNLNIDPSKEPSNTNMLIYLILAVLVLMIFYKIISGINERENARKANEPIPGYSRPVSDLVRTPVQHRSVNLRQCTL